MVYRLHFRSKSVEYSRLTFLFPSKLMAILLERIILPTTPCPRGWPLTAKDASLDTMRIQRPVVRWDISLNHFIMKEFMLYYWTPTGMALVPPLGPPVLVPLSQRNSLQPGRQSVRLVVECELRRIGAIVPEQWRTVSHPGAPTGG